MNELKTVQDVRMNVEWTYICLPSNNEYILLLVVANKPDETGKYKIWYYQNRPEFNPDGCVETPYGYPEYLYTNSIEEIKTYFKVGFGFENLSELYLWMD